MRYKQKLKKNTKQIMKKSIKSKILFFFCFSKGKPLDRKIKNKRRHHYGSYRVIQTIRDYITNNFISVHLSK